MLRLKWANLLGVLIILALLLAPTTHRLQRKRAPEIHRRKFSILPMEHIEVVDGPPFFYFMTDRSLRFDRSANRVPCVAYGGDHLYYSCWNNSATDSWSKEIVDANPMVGSYAALDFNNYNIPFISYYDALNATLKLAYKAGIGWQKFDSGHRGR